jgi:hypothetical protein
MDYIYPGSDMEHGKEFSKSIQHGELDEWEFLDQAEGVQPRELPSPLSTGKPHFLKSLHTPVYTPADLREGSDVTILIFRKSTSAHFSLIHDS